MNYIKIIITFVGMFLTTVTFSQNKLVELYQTGTANFSTGKFEKAIKNYTELLKIVDDSSLQKTCYINRGLSYDRLRKYDLAITDFTEAIKRDSADLASFIDRGLSKMHAGYLEKAKEDYQYVVTQNNNHSMMEAALYWLARIHSSEGNYEEVVKNCDQYLKINPKDYEVHFIRGTANDMLGAFEESIKDYTKVIELKPNIKEAYANRGTAKINILTTRGTITPSKEQTKDACIDLKKAYELGDKVIEDLVFVYCDNK
ncbi:Photosystem I assembly protein Ycf3 [Kordia antarctica]|uniref:Photosystem I assembly protein Ycf3 n=1 Tax=Kordia antarctica TaxID=1218801 RepID=A0A7L4ZP46_9FLAO|nr:tetratricopeptide repeat protein [Kordia antarctica]QHI37684.1 Photosystem I assembly protein Ycf3 [Kordia antarctica]